MHRINGHDSQRYRRSVLPEDIGELRVALDDQGGESGIGCDAENDIDDDGDESGYLDVTPRWAYEIAPSAHKSNGPPWSKVQPNQRIKPKLKFTAKTLTAAGITTTPMVKTKAVNKFDWQRAVSSHQGPPNPMTRHILLAMSVHMDGKRNENGKLKDGHTFVSQDRLVLDTGHSLNTIKKYLREAVKGGWIRRTKRTDRHGRQSGNEHHATIPARVKAVDRSRALTDQQTYRGGVK